MGGRSWRWGLVWGATLETISLATPLARVYGLAGQPLVIALAYGGHFAYGTVLGRVAQGAGGDEPGAGAEAPNAGGEEPGAGDPLPTRAGPIAMAVVAVALLAWLRPWSTPAPMREAALITPAPAAVIRAGRFIPEWLRVGTRQCVTVQNDDDRPHVLNVGTSPAVGAHAAARLCFTTAGVQRVKADGRPFSGGFVLVDPALPGGVR
jgi:hypothetical protein